MSNKLIETTDGSHTLESEKFGVSYHSIHGAIQETNHVFIDAGLLHKSKSKNDLSILEIGWGTGLNSYVTYLEAQKNKLNINYTTYELYPISLEQSQELNYKEKLNDNSDILQKLHLAPWDKQIELSDFFTFEKRKKDFLSIDIKNEFDIIYFDAFAPNAQPEFWDENMMQKMYDALKPEGILTTYCAKGSFKRAMKSVGFQVEALPGPPRKREMTRGLKL